MKKKSIFIILSLCLILVIIIACIVFLDLPSQKSNEQTANSQVTTSPETTPQRKKDLTAEEIITEMKKSIPSIGRIEICTAETDPNKLLRTTS